jgi:hypothetical protein
VEVKISTVGGFYEAAILLGQETHDPTMRLRIVVIHITPDLTHMVLELPTRRLKGIPQSDGQMLMCGHIAVPVIDHDFLMTWHSDRDLDPEGFAGAMSGFWRGDRNPAGGDSGMKRLEPCDFTLHLRANLIAGLHVLEGDLWADLHRHNSTKTGGDHSGSGPASDLIAGKNTAIGREAVANRLADSRPI